MARRILLGLYVANLLTWAGLFGAGYLVEPGGYLAGLREVAYWTSPLFLVGAFVSAFLPPSRWSLVVGLMLVGLWPATTFVPGLLRPHSRELFFRSRQSDFQALADASLQSGRIRSMWNSIDGYRLLNGHLVAIPEGASTTFLWGKPLEPLDDVLRAEGIAPEEYAAFARQLRSLHVETLFVSASTVSLGGRDAGFTYEAERLTGDSARQSNRTRRQLTARWSYSAW